MTPTNGKPKPPPATLAELRESARRARLTASLRRAEAETKLYESLCWGGDAFDYGEMWGQLRFRDASGQEWLPLINSPTDRRHGQNWPIWQTLQELDRLRQASRVLLATNGYAQGLVGNYVNYVLDEGCSYKVVSKELKDGDPEKPGVQDPEQIKLWVKKGQDVVDRFLEVNQWNAPAAHEAVGVIADSGEREMMRRVIRDGEALVRYHPQENGDLQVRFPEPEQLRDPPGATTRDGWTFGIRHSMDPYEDVKTRLAYHFQWMDPTTTPEGSEPQGETVDAAEVLHVLAPGTDSTVKRGTPMLSYDVFDALVRAARLQRNTSVGASVRAATAEIWKHATGTKEQIQDLAAGLASVTRPNPVTGKEERVERMPPGGIRRVPAGQEPVFPAPDNSAAYLQAGQGDLRLAATAFSAPEYWLGDASNGNYASLQEASAPTVKAGKSSQGRLRAAFACIARKALRVAADAGVIDAEALEFIDVNVEGPAVLHRNELEDSQVRSIEAQNQVLSPQTWCAEKGRDYEIESANIAEHRDKLGGAGSPLPQPGDQPPGGGADDPFGGGTPGLQESLELRLLEDGFTGIDRHGHRWVSGRQVKRGDQGGDRGPAGGVAVKAKRLAAHVAGHLKVAVAAGVRRAIDGLDEESKNGPSLILGGVKARSPAAVAHGIAQCVRVVFEDVHQEVYETAMADHSLPGAHTLGKLAGKALAAGERALLKGVALAMRRGQVALGLAESLELWEADAAGELSPLDRAIVGACVQAARDALRHVYAEAGLGDDALPDPKALAARLAARLTGAGVQESAGDQGDRGERLHLVAEILAATYGDQALEWLDQGHAVRESLEAALLESGFTGTIKDKRGHTRHYVNGKQVRSPAEHHAAARGHVKAALQGERSPEKLHALVEHLGSMTVAQLHALKKEHGISASGKVKAELVARIADRLDRGRRYGAPAPTPGAPGKPKAGPGKGAPAKAKAIDLKDPQALADAVHDAGKRLPDALTGQPHAPDAPAWQSHKAFVHELYDELKPRLGAATLDDFKAALTRAGHAGALNLSRIDLVQSVPDRGGVKGLDRVERSRIGDTAQGSEVHAVNVGRKAAPPPPAKAAAAPKPPVPEGMKLTASDEARDIHVATDANGDRTTLFRPGQGEAAAKALAEPLAKGLGYASMFRESQGGMIPLDLAVHQIKQQAPAGTTTGDVLAALDHMSKTRALDLHILNETWALDPKNPKAKQLPGVRGVDDSQDPATATIWKNGRAMHFIHVPKK